MFEFGIIIISLIITIIWLGFWTIIISTSYYNSNFVGLFFGIIFTGIIWGATWIYITDLMQKKTSPKKVIDNNLNNKIK